jgi:cytochrome c oxidase subunit 4
MSQNNEKHHIVSYLQNLWVWIALLILTFITVAVAGVEFKKLAVAVALTIASIKSVIVAAYFMHLRFENKMISIMSIIVLFIFTVFIVFTLVDYSMR